MRTFCKALISIYGVLCIAALAIIPLNAIGFVGEADPLTAVYAVLLSMPWIWLAGPFASDSGTVLNMIMAAAGMALNVLILWKLCGWFASTTSPRRSR